MAHVLRPAAAVDLRDLHSRLAASSPQLASAMQQAERAVATVVRSGQQMGAVGADGARSIGVLSGGIRDLESRIASGRGAVDRFGAKLGEFGTAGASAQQSLSMLNGTIGNLATTTVAAAAALSVGGLLGGIVAVGAAVGAAIVLFTNWNSLQREAINLYQRRRQLATGTAPTSADMPAVEAFEAEADQATNPAGAAPARASRPIAT